MKAEELLTDVFAHDMIFINIINLGAHMNQRYMYNYMEMMYRHIRL